ncbi:CsbD family protein [Solimonas marina]|uniref:CsbD family protein n=1 Tax=Solimonas marina TaxID=2714601 RepID=A0A969WE33_9GAMM|nr:CsbD family protein [Solimonas marina]NKF24529.1 CsbD family protein [Solimonas marina]
MDTNQAKRETQSAVDQARHSAEADRARGKTKQVAGKVREKVGDAIDDREMAAEGTRQRAEGRAEEVKGNVKAKIDDAADTVKGAAEAIREKWQDVRKH